MIRLRRTLERDRAHPIIGPVLLIVLVLMLGLLFLHAVDDGHDAATEVGALCLAVATFLSLLLLERLRRRSADPIVLVRSDRGPPDSTHTQPGPLPRVAAAVSTLPLRR